MRRKGNPSETAEEPKEPEQLFRYRGSTVDAQLLLERDDLTDEDIRRFCLQEPTTTMNDAHSQADSDDTTNTSTMGPSSTRASSSHSHQQHHNAQQKAYRARRNELQRLTRALRHGRARIDDDLRIVPVLQQNPPQPPAMDLPPPPRNNHLAAPQQQQRPEHDNDDEDQQQWLTQQERAAADAIARAVERYRQKGVSDQDLCLVPVPPLLPRDDDDDNDDLAAVMTFRRICVAVLAVATAFIGIMLQQTLFFQTTTTSSGTHDTMMMDTKLMHQLLHDVKLLVPHVQQCGLSRATNMGPTARSGWYDSLVGWWWRDNRRISTVDCSDGVLHIPALQTVINAFVKSKSSEEVAMLKPFVTHGVNESWFFPCAPPPHITWRSSPSSSSLQSSCDNVADDNKSCCFRGVHDNFLTEREIRDSLALGASLIAKGGDHFDIHRDVNLLRKQLPSVLAKLDALLTGRYGVATSQVVAFRVHAVGPMDGAGVPLFRATSSSSSSSLARLLNRTNYVRWIEKAQRRNEIAQFSLPWPFRIPVLRDPCILVADMEADASFAVQTSIFLSDGAGEDYWGGAALYVDNDPSNSNPRKKIKRGMTIDGSRGRLIVSTGGLENRRCRLPTRAGIRAALQIWWKIN